MIFTILVVAIGLIGLLMVLLVLLQSGKGGGALRYRLGRCHAAGPRCSSGPRRSREGYLDARHRIYRALSAFQLRYGRWRGAGERHPAACQRGTDAAATAATCRASGWWRRKQPAADGPCTGSRSAAGASRGRAAATAGSAVGRLPFRLRGQIRHLRMRLPSATMTRAGPCGKFQPAGLFFPVSVNHGWTWTDARTNKLLARRALLERSRNVILLHR